MSIFVGGDPICPCCHESTGVAGYKVHDGKRWWHKCHNDHGPYNLDGKDYELPKPLFFTDDGQIETPHGVLVIDYQVPIDNDL